MKKFFSFIPNLLSIIRIGLVYPILNGIYYANYQFAIFIFVIASFTDALDGFIARQMQWQSQLGKILDPVADKLLISGAIFVLWITQLIPFYVFLVLISRDVIILLGASVHMTIIDLNPPSPNIYGKATTFLQIIYVFTILFFNYMNFNSYNMFLEIIVISLTVFSLIVYIKDWIKNLKDHEGKN